MDTSEGRQINYRNPGLAGVFHFLEFCYYCILSDCTGNGILTYDLASAAADDKGRADVRLFIFEVDGLAEMSVGEHLAIHYITCVVADDQPKLFSRGIFKIHVEDNVLITYANVLDGDLLVVELCFIVLAAISQAGDWIAKKEYSCYGCY